MSSKITKKPRISVSNQKNQLLTIDWLTINVEDVFASLIFDENDQCKYRDYVITKSDRRTQLFKNHAFVHFLGKKIAEITYDSSSPTILKGKAQIKFENYIFYSGEAWEVVTTMIREFKIKFVTVSRLDIACDGVSFHKFINKFLKHEVKNKTQNSFKRVGRATPIVPYSNDISVIYNNKYDAFYIGQKGSKKSKRSDRFGRYYNKTKELEEQGEKKDYISKYLVANGFSGDVYRFEIQFKGEYIKKLENFHFLDLFNEQELKNVFLTATKGFFEFAYNTHKSITKCERVDFFPSIKKTRIYTKVKKVIKESVRTVQIAIKRLLKEIYTGVFNSRKDNDLRIKTLDVAMGLVTAYNLGDWFRKIYPYLWSEIKIKCLQNNVPLVNLPKQIQIQF